jgi:hypothetical protein
VSGCAVHAAAHVRRGAAREALPAFSAGERRRERRQVQDAMARDVPASSVRENETLGYGSTARWTHTSREERS